MSTLLTLGARVLAASSLAFLGAVIYSYGRMLYRRTKLPPGPFPWPIVGKMLQLNASKTWLQFEKLSQENNEGLLKIWIGRSPIIVCNDAWSASELLEKRPRIYSSRPRYVLFGEVTNQYDINQVFLPYNDHWRAQRKVMHIGLGSQALKPYKSFQEDEGKVLMGELIDSPKNFPHYLERYAGSLVSILAYGRRINSVDDDMLRFAVNLMENTTTMQVPGLYWLEAIPELQYLPSWIYPLPSMMKAMSNAGNKYWWGLLTEAADAPNPNFAKTPVKSREEHGLSEDSILTMAANLIGGGLNTTSSTLHTLVLGLCAFQDAQQKAHEELERVIGDRSPTWEDIEHLPYCAAVVKEAMRWRSVTAMGGFAHCPIKDDEYRDYQFHAGIPVFGNLWGIHRRPQEFPDPDRFNPDRFLDENRIPYLNSKGHHAFGWGRRACSGQYSPNRGNPVKLDIFAYIDAENTQPRPFLARFIPRSERIKDIIVQDAAGARERLRKYDGEAKTKFIM